MTDYNLPSAESLARVDFREEGLLCKARLSGFARSARGISPPPHAGVGAADDGDRLRHHILHRGEDRPVTVANFAPNPSPVIPARFGAVVPAVDRAAGWSANRGDTPGCSPPFEPPCANRRGSGFGSRLSCELRHGGNGGWPQFAEVWLDGARARRLEPHGSVMCSKTGHSICSRHFRHRTCDRKR